jgi:hypothetical protein
MPAAIPYRPRPIRVVGKRRAMSHGAQVEPRPGRRPAKEARPQRPRQARRRQCFNTRNASTNIGKGRRGRGGKRQPLKDARLPFATKRHPVPGDSAKHCGRKAVCDRCPFASRHGPLAIGKAARTPLSLSFRAGTVFGQYIAWPSLRGRRASPGPMIRRDPPGPWAYPGRSGVRALLPRDPASFETCRSAGASPFAASARFHHEAPSPMLP